MLLSSVTLLSIILISLETVANLSEYDQVFRWAEYVIVSIFTLEYVARIYVHDEKLKYVVSPFGIIDVVSILPTLVGFANLTYIKAARIARVLEFLRLSRMAKLARMNKYANSHSLKAREIRVISIRIYGIVLVAAIYVFGSTLYLIEGSRNPHFQDIPAAILWAALALLGGSINPEELSLLAKFVVILLQFSSLLLFGLMIHIVGRFIEYKLLGSSSLQK